MDVMDPVSANKNYLSMWFLPQQELESSQFHRCSAPRDQQCYRSIIGLHQSDNQHKQNPSPLSPIKSQLNTINLSFHGSLREQLEKIDAKTLLQIINEGLTKYQEKNSDQKREYQFFTAIYGKNDRFFLFLQKRFYCQPYFKNSIEQFSQGKKGSSANARALFNINRTVFWSLQLNLRPLSIRLVDPIMM